MAPEGDFSRGSEGLLINDIERVGGRNRPHRMAGNSSLSFLMQRARRAFEYLWGYTGTLAAMGLLLGVSAMGLRHVWGEKGPEYRCFSGLFNSARAEIPLGLGELPTAGAEVVGPHLRFEYGKGGRLERLVHIGADGLRSAMPGSRVAEQRLEYDEKGRITSKRNFSAGGHPAPDGSGVAIRQYHYDDAGRLVRTVFRDEHARRIVPRMPGYASETISYDDAGRPRRMEYRDGEDELVVNARGESCVEYTYDDARHSSVRTNWVDGTPRENRQGIASERRQMTADGQALRISWYDASGRPVVNPEVGASSILQEKGAEGTLVRHRFCGENGVMRGDGRTCSEHLVRNTPEGVLEWECFNAADGMPCFNESRGYAERVCEYRGDGSLEREYFWDAEGNPTPCYEKRYAHDASGRHVLSLHTDGSTEWRRE